MYVRTSELFSSVCVFSWRGEQMRETKPASDTEGQIPA